MSPPATAWQKQYSFAIVTLSKNDTMTKTADLLAFGLNYKIEEILTTEERTYFNTSVENWNGVITTGDGAAIYLAEGSLLNISGAPLFRNNVVSFSDTTEQNGGENVYAGGTARQDIYLAGYASTSAASIVVRGDLDYADPSHPESIWIWPDQPLHYEQGRQFARLYNEQPYEGVNIFRNARPDSLTGNLCQDTPAYLYGVIRNNAVYWSGTVDLTVSKTVSGDFADPQLDFPFTVSGLTVNETYAYERYTSTDGTTWPTTPTESGTFTALASGGGDPTGMISFPLKHNEKIVIRIPAGTEVSIVEDPGSYTPSYTVNGDLSHDGSGLSYTLSSDAVIAFTNHMDAPSPTGLRFRYAPYALLLTAGLVLLSISRKRRRYRRGEA